MFHCKEAIILLILGKARIFLEISGIFQRKFYIPEPFLPLINTLLFLDTLKFNPLIKS
jgi:hypothetical protein